MRLSISVLLVLLGILGILWIVQAISVIDFDVGSIFVYGVDKRHYYDGSPSFSPDGSKIVFSSNMWDDDLEIYRMNLDGRNRVRLTHRLGRDGNPSYSPDGKEILYVSAENNTWGIFSMRADGRNKHRLGGSFESRIASLSYSPDGRKMIFSMNQNIYIMNADGSSITKLTNFDSKEPVEVNLGNFSPDGSKIVFSLKGSFREDEKTKSEYGIYVMNADGSQISHFANTSWGDRWPHYSPDGKSIVFCSYRPRKHAGDEGTTISIMDSDGQNLRPLANNDFVCFEPSYSPDGSKIVFSGQLGWDWVIYSMNSDGSGQRSISRYWGVFDRTLRPMLAFIGLVFIVLIGQVLAHIRKKISFKFQGHNT